MNLNELNVKLLRLVSGEEIVAYATEYDNQGELKVFHPYMLIRTGETQISFVEWMPYIKKENGVPLHHKDIIFPASPIDSFVKQYTAIIKEKTTGLVATSAPKLVV